MLDTGLKGKVVLVTGANHGIGAATAVAFAREGAYCFSDISAAFSRCPQAAEIDPQKAAIAREPGRNITTKFSARMPGRRDPLYSCALGAGAKPGKQICRTRTIFLA